MFSAFYHSWFLKTALQNRMVKSLASLYAILVKTIFLPSLLPEVVYASVKQNADFDKKHCF